MKKRSSQQTEALDAFLRGQFGATLCKTQGLNSRVYRAERSPDGLPIVLKVLKELGRPGVKQELKASLDINNQSDLPPSLMPILDILRLGQDLCAIMMPQHVPIATKYNVQQLRLDELKHMATDIISAVQFLKDTLNGIHIDIDVRNIYRGEDGRFILGDYGAIVPNRQDAVVNMPRRLTPPDCSAPFQWDVLESIPAYQLGIALLEAAVQQIFLLKPAVALQSIEEQLGVDTGQLSDINAYVIHGLISRLSDAFGNLVSELGLPTLVLEGDEELSFSCTQTQGGIIDRFAGEYYPVFFYTYALNANQKPLHEQLEKGSVEGHAVQFDQSIGEFWDGYLSDEESYNLDSEYTIYYQGKEWSIDQEGGEFAIHEDKLVLTQCFSAECHTITLIKGTDGIYIEAGDGDVLDDEQMRIHISNPREFWVVSQDQDGEEGRVLTLDCMKDGDIDPDIPSKQLKADTLAGNKLLKCTDLRALTSYMQFCTYVSDLLQEMRVRPNVDELGEDLLSTASGRVFVHPGTKVEAVAISTDRSFGAQRVSEQSASVPSSIQEDVEMSDYQESVMQV